MAPWYHTLELPGGIVTDGYFDLRTVVGKLPLPESLAGRRCLDLPDTSAQDSQGLRSAT